MGKKICIIQTGTASSEELMTPCAEMMPESSSSRVTFSILPRRVSDRYSEAMSRSNRRVILSAAALAAMTTSSPSLT